MLLFQNSGEWKFKTSGMIVQILCLYQLRDLGIDTSKACLPIHRQIDLAAQAPVALKRRKIVVQTLHITYQSKSTVGVSASI